MKDLLLIHGWGFGQRVWTPVAERLARRFRVHLASLPGYGEPLAADRIPAGSTLCGWSLGAQEAMRLAVAQPQQVARLVLVGATPRFVRTDDWPHGLPPDVLDGFATAVADDPSLALRRFAALVNHGDDDALTTTRKLNSLAVSGQPSPAVLFGGLRALRDTDLRPVVGRIVQPTLIVHGEKDELIPVAAASWLADVVGHGRLATMPGRAHAPFLSASKLFADLITEFSLG
jgi:pimeloyl-[acyl-carrier protein] methyl ester esterase